MSVDGDDAQPAAEDTLDVLLAHLKGTRGFDFTGYKRTSLERRIQKRMDAVELSDYSEYLDYLEVHPEEYELLLDTLLINVTEFFRDAPSWEHLADDVLPGLIAEKPAHHTRIGASGPIASSSLGTMSAA